jgi:ATP-dependent Clp protease ATP-binding subunit ClpC
MLDTRKGVVRTYPTQPPFQKRVIDCRLVCPIKRCTLNRPSHKGPRALVAAEQEKPHANNEAIDLNDILWVHGSLAYDEIEKAHPDIFNSLLQVLEEGRLTDGQGRVVDFKNTVIIMTTNLGTKDITGGPVGFTMEGNEEASYQAMRAKVVEELKKNFKPEFLNRVDETIVFPQLTQEELMQVVGLFVKRLSERMLDRDMTVAVSTPAKQRLIEIGWDPTMGARPLRRAVQQNVEDPLSERILQGELSPGQHVEVDFVDDEFTFTTSKPASAEPVGAGVSES